MLFWLALIVSAVGLLWLIMDDCSFCGITLSASGIIAVVFSLVFISINYIGVNGYVAQMEMRYEMLTYQLDNEFYENDNDVGKYELVSKIQDWNEDLSFRKTMQRNFWIGIFIPNIYDQFEYIPLEEQ